MTDPTLRELELRIDHERQLREAHEKAIADAQNLRATEVERRLVTLNGEYGRIDRVLQSTIPREVFESFEESIDKRIEVLQEQYSRLDRSLSSFIPGDALERRLGTLEDSELQRVTREIEREQQTTRRELERDRSLQRTMALVGVVAAVVSFLLGLLVRLLGIG